MPDHHMIPGLRFRLNDLNLPADAIEAVVALINDDPVRLNECGFRFGDGGCIRVRGHTESVGDLTHVNLFGQTKHGEYAVRNPSLF